MNKSTFVKGVERLINPIDVGTIHFIQYFNNFIPKKIQKKMVDASGTKTPYMGFVVEPYSYFLGYEIQDFDRAKEFLPDGYKLAKTKIFETDEPKYYGIFGCFNAHTSGFWGLRIEFYLIAENTETGLMSWIIVDYDTNTITYDPKNGLCDPNASDAMMTIDYNGELYVDVVNNNGRQLIFSSDVKSGVMTALDQRLWVEGNLSIAYGRHKSEEDPGLFSLIFDPMEFEKGLNIPKESFQLEINNWYPGLLKAEPEQLICFPYAQHFLSDSPGHSSMIRNEDDLIDTLKTIDFSAIQTFSTKAFKTMFLVGGLAAFLTNVVLIISLVRKK